MVIRFTEGTNDVSISRKYTISSPNMPQWKCKFHQKIILWT